VAVVVVLLHITQMPVAVARVAIELLLGNLVVEQALKVFLQLLTLPSP
jgi:hypothetical protein